MARSAGHLVSFERELFAAENPKGTATGFDPDGPPRSRWRPPCCADCAEFNGTGCPGGSVWCLSADKIAAMLRMSAERIVDEITTLAAAIEVALEPGTPRHAREIKRARHLHRQATQAVEMLAALASRPVDDL